MSIFLPFSSIHCSLSYMSREGVSYSCRFLPHFLLFHFSHLRDAYFTPWLGLGSVAPTSQQDPQTSMTCLLLLPPTFPRRWIGWLIGCFVGSLVAEVVMQGFTAGPVRPSIVLRYLGVLTPHTFLQKSRMRCIDAQHVKCHNYLSP